MNVLTIIVCAYLVLAALRGLFRGCVRTVFSMLYLVALIALTLLLTPLTSKVIAGSQYVRGYFTEQSNAFLSTYMTSSGTVDLTPLARQTGASDSPFQAASAVINILLSSSGDREAVSAKVVGFLIGATATVATFVIILIALIILRIILGRQAKKKGVRALDHALGLPLGLARGLIVVWVALAVINLLAFLPNVSGVAAQITASPILTWLNDNNLIVRGLTALVSGAFA